MKIAVCGSSGYVGSHLYAALVANGYFVKTIGRNKSGLIMSSENALVFNPKTDSLGTLSSFLEDVDLLYNCSGVIGQSDDMHSAHILLVQALIDAASKAGVSRFVHLSSVGIYGPPRDLVVTELHELNPINNYEKSKLASEKIILETASIKKIEFVILRPSNIFGNGMPNSSLFQLINAIHNRTFFYIGNKLGKMNYIHIENVVNALLLCGFHPNAKNQIFNLSDNCSIEKFIESLSKELGKINFYPTIPSALVNFLVKLLKFLPKLPLTKSRIDALRVKAIYSNEKIEAMLGYRSKVDIQSGLSRLVISWRNKFDVQAGYK